MRDPASARPAPGIAPATPLVELHLHLEGAFPAPRAARLARERGLLPPPTGGLDAGAWRFRTLPEFLGLFGWMTRLLDGPAVYDELLATLLDELERQQIVYAEVFVALGQMHKAGVDPGRVLPVLAHRAQQRARAGGPEVRFIADATRQLGVEAAARVVDQAVELAADCRIVGFGMGGDERALPAAHFKSVYERARRAGLGTTVHAGEGTGAGAVRDAVAALPLTRIGHGISAIEDSGLVAELASRGVALEICPTSNLRTGAWDPAVRGRPHPLLELARAGVPVVLGSDDPAFFGASLRGEFALAGTWGASRRELEKWNSTAALVSFLPDPQRQRLCARVLAAAAPGAP